MDEDRYRRIVAIAAEATGHLHAADNLLSELAGLVPDADLPLVCFIRDHILAALHGPHKRGE